MKKPFWTVAAGLAFLIFGYATISKWFHLKAIYDKKAHFEGKVVCLERKKASLLKDLEGQNDPVWLELVMMEELGVIPEGAIKINYLEDE